MDEIQLLDGFRGEAFATLPCQDGGGSIARYPLFDGVNALLVRLQTHGFEELRDQRDRLFPARTGYADAWRAVCQLL